LERLPHPRAAASRASAPSVSGAFSRLLDGWLPSRRRPISDSSTGAQQRRSDRTFDRVITLQRADGSWDFDEALLAACGLPRNRMTAIEALVPAGSQDEGRRAMATAIALTFLRRRAADDESEWALLGEKAERYLAGIAVVPTSAATWLKVASMLFDSVHTA
jgi:hypothetical protein